MHFAICDYILDMVQNSLEAGADLVELNLTERYNGLTLILKDNGCGMTEVELERAKDPFYTDGVKHASRKVGLGIPFLIQMAETSEGMFDIKSEKGVGTEVTVFFNTSNIDTPPVGDLVSLFFQAMTFDGSYELIVNRQFPSGGKENYDLVRSQLKEILGDLNRAETMGLLRDFIASQEEN
ncbi:MAG: sensor histidine kinase [Spirochaetales bacterium]|nr:sensor histidine kinase [Spirochaetales bacterium]